MEDRLEHRVLRVEVVVEEPVRDAGLLGDVADPARVESLAREHANGGVEDLTPLFLQSLPGARPSGQRRHSAASPSVTPAFARHVRDAPATFPSACWNSLGMIQTLFASPCAICGSTCRYW